MKKSLFGYGLTTKAIAKSGGWEIFDDKFGSDGCDEFGNKLLNPDKFDPNLSELEIPSPGFPMSHKIVKSARNLISEYDYFFNASPPTIWISGTNGKTTTTKMTQHLLEKFGSLMGGNVGTPLGDLVDKNAKLWVLETSSFTLHYTKFASPNLYILLPITPDHLSWHGSMREYENAKLKPLKMMKEGSMAIIPEIYLNHYFVKESMAEIISYNNENDLAKKFQIDVAKVDFKVPFLIDAIFALVARRMIVGDINYDEINTFKIEAHKLEEFGDRFGRIWVNDTKATNIDATMQALKRYGNKKIHIILGGDDKGVDLTPIFSAMQSLNIQIYAIGTNTAKIMDYANKFGLNAIKCEYLKEAVSAIAGSLKADEIALLSPACASLDQFVSYSQRGNLFKQYVQSL